MRQSGDENMKNGPHAGPFLTSISGTRSDLANGSACPSGRQIVNRSKVKVSRPIGSNTEPVKVI
jgi:hypothetical protein